MPVFTKAGVGQAEVDAHMRALSHGVRAPQIHSYDAATQTLTMEAVGSMSVANFYGKHEPPDWVWDEARNLVCQLLDCGISYPDITGYNFMMPLDDDEVYGGLWVIDFGHAVQSPLSDLTPEHEFVTDFIDGQNLWNPHFA